jgi:hypothetical protein
VKIRISVLEYFVEHEIKGMDKKQKIKDIDILMNLNIIRYVV